MKIIVDTREQCPFSFRHERMDATTEPGELWPWGITLLPDWKTG